MTRPRRVALLIESSRGYGRGLLHGIAEYLRACGPWTLSFERHGLYQRVPAWMGDWHGDGIIARVENRGLATAIHRLRVPSVDLRGRLRDLPMPAILTDDAAGTRLAAEHLLERGFRRFAYCGFAGLSYSAERLRVFSETVQAAGYPCATYLPPARCRVLLEEDNVRFTPAGLADEGVSGRQVGMVIMSGRRRSSRTSATKNHRLPSPCHFPGRVAGDFAVVTTQKDCT